MTLFRLFVIFLLATGVAACGQQAPPPSVPALPPPVTTSSVAPGGFGATEESFVQLAIATDDQALLLLDLGATDATDPLLRDFAKDLAAARRTELTALHGLLDAAAVEYQNLHKGHDMPGMPTEDELATLRAAPAFDVEFARLARAHLTESRTVAASAADNATHPDTRALAASMVDERDTTLARLDTLA
ncbi:hypothetical protein BLA60_24555 [Actinophytocola xinjiangensis]|uniref:DUF305 domain-containing protein n=1 Tax=Actinophytocola xinjiangensis TaxID=485602 RepID=A0A7Z0WJD5_9PSEU|nr:DUF305 domain-containing protein [Actinophytocola xinjiangensis]OLF08046.1 hypothetical protein BLA60_24555 [Actinophytocola xinjiangensis]